MSLENCKFCGSELSGEVCSWCGFPVCSQQGLPGVLGYGTVLKDYVVGDVIDMDGESTSYQAYSRATQTKILVKEFLPVSMVGPRTGNNIAVQQGKEVLFKNLMMDFTDLYKSLSAIESKNIQKIIEIFGANGTVYVAMEVVKGDNLRQNLIKRGKPYTFKEARWLFQQLFELLNVLEKNNIAHGGISDETVVVTADNTIVLTNFAIRDLRVKNEHIIYKLYENFSAPEQYCLNQFSGFYTDIYSVAALFYHAVTGRPFLAENLGLKDLSRYMPKYAIEALKYATKENPQDRLDNIQDFVMMLDNKATIAKPEKKKETSGKNSPGLNKKLTAVIMGLIIVLFVAGIMAVSSSVNSSSSQISSEASSDISSQPDADKVTVPQFVGKTYKEIMNTPEIVNNFYFYTTEEFNSRPAGQIIAQNPQENTLIEKGASIYLTISKGKEEIKVQIPYGLAGRPLDEVQGLLETMGIPYITKYVPQSRQYAFGTVTGTDIPEGVMIDPQETYLIVYVADNTPVAEMPRN